MRYASRKMREHEDFIKDHLLMGEMGTAKDIIPVSSYRSETIPGTRQKVILN